MMFFDSHTHVNDPLLFDRAEEVIQAAKQAGVEGMLLIGYDLPSCERALELAGRFDGVYAAIGFHPTNASTVTEEDLDWLVKQLSNPRVKAIGEIGLDYYWDATNKETQISLFKKQLDIAYEHHLPFSVHMRDATEDTLRVLQTYKHKDHKGVMHCFSGSVESAREFIACNMMISLAGPVTFKNAKVPKQVALEIDLKNLLIETDAPYLAPHPYRGKQNEPKYVGLVAAEIANIKGIPVEEIAFETTTSAKKLFHIE